MYIETSFSAAVIVYGSKTFLYSIFWLKVSYDIFSSSKWFKLNLQYKYINLND